MIMEELIEKETNKYAKKFYTMLQRDDYTVVDGEYTDAKTKILIRHNKCGHEYKTDYSNFQGGNRCPECAKAIVLEKRRIATAKKFNDSLKREGCEMIDENKYKDKDTKIEVIHHECSHRFWVVPDTLYGKVRSRCPKCRLKLKRKPYAPSALRKSHDQFCKEVYDIVGDEYTVLGKYKTIATKVLMRHNSKECDYYEWHISPNRFFSNGSRCPKCNGYFRHNTTTFKEEVAKITKNEYEVLGDFIDISTHIKVRHNSKYCGFHEYDMSPYRLLRGKGCPKCTHLKTSIEKRKSPEKFRQEVYDLVKDEYSLLSEYTRSKDHVSMKHNICGNTYQVTPLDFLAGCRCPVCAASKGEVKIRNYIQYLNNDINYERERSFLECRGKIKPLPFDFYISNKILVEYDGIGHFQPIEHWGGEERFGQRKEYDKIKNQYCIDNNIPLIRIPYWEFENIEYILENTLKYFSIIDGQPSDIEIAEKYYVNGNWNHDTYLNMNNKEKVTQ